MRSWPTEPDSSDPPATGTEATRPRVFLWEMDKRLVRRFLADLRPERGLIEDLPAPTDLPLAAPRVLIILAATAPRVLPWRDIEKLREAREIEWVLLLPRCSDKEWRRLIRRGFRDVLSPPFEPGDLDRLLDQPLAADPPARRLGELEQKLRTKTAFVLPADMKFVLPVADMVSHLARMHGFPERVWKENLPLAVDEALSNAIEHGCRRDPELSVQIEVWIGHDVFKVRIEDPGEGFVASQVADPRSASGLVKAGGRGLLLMRELMDRVEFEAGGRVVVLYARRRPGGQGS